MQETSKCRASECEQAKSGFCCYCENYAYEQLRQKLRELITQADSKSQELMLGDFKQYFDEEFSPAIWEIMV